MVLDASGNPVITLHGSGYLKILHCNDPDCSGGDENLTFPDVTAPAGPSPSIALDASGFPVVSYYDATNGDLKILHCNDADCADGDESIAAPDTAGDVGAFTSLRLDPAGRPVVTYHHWDNGSLKLLHCNDVNCVGGDESIVVIGASFRSSLALDALGLPVVLFEDGGLNLMHCNDPNCAGGDEHIGHIDGGGYIAGARSLALDAAGNPAIAFDKGGLAIARCNDPNCESPGEIITFPAGTAGIYTSIELDARDNPVIAFYENTIAADLLVLHCNDPYCAFGAEALVRADTAGDVGRYASMALDMDGNPVVAYAAEPPSYFGDRVRVLHCGSITCKKPQDPSFGLDISIGVNVDGLSGDDCQTKAAGPTACGVPLGETFVVNVYLNSLPHGLSGFRDFTVRLDYLNVTLKHTPDAGVWPDCVSEDLSVPEPTHVEWGCTATSDSTYTGLIGTAEFTCSGDGLIELSSTGTRLHDSQGGEYDDSGMPELLSLYCLDMPTPTPTADAIGGAAFDAPMRRGDAFGAQGLVTFAAASFATLSGAALYAGRRFVAKEADR